MGWSTHHPIGLIYYAPQHTYRGYTLTTNVRGGGYANLIDMEGRVCHRWYSSEGIGYAYLLDNAHLLLRTDPPEDAGGAESIGGSSGALLELDWESNVVWEHRNPMLHRDFERLPNGNTLLLLFELLSPELTAQIKGGMAGDEDPERMFGDLVQERSPPRAKWFTSGVPGSTWTWMQTLSAPWRTARNGPTATPSTLPLTAT